MHRHTDEAPAHSPIALALTVQVIDEGDRLLQQSYQGWLSKVLESAYRPAPPHPEACMYVYKTRVVCVCAGVRGP